MIEQRTIELGNLRAHIILTTTNGDAHSKVGDNPGVIAELWGAFTDNLDYADASIQAIPNKEIRLAEGCK